MMKINEINLYINNDSEEEIDEELLSIVMAFVIKDENLSDQSIANLQIASDATSADLN